MTTSNFRKQAIATLKQLRSEGYKLTIQLNGSNTQLHAELMRLNNIIDAQEIEVYEQLNEANEARYQHAIDTELAAKLEADVAQQQLNDLKATEFANSVTSWVDKQYEKAQAEHRRKATQESVAIITFAELQSLEDQAKANTTKTKALSAQCFIPVTASQQRITKRAEGTKALANHLSHCWSLVITLLSLVLSLPLALMNDAIDHVERKALEHCPDVVELLIHVGDAVRSIQPVEVLDRVCFCLEG